MTKELQEALYKTGFEFNTVGDSGSKEGVCLYIHLNKEQSASCYVDESDCFVLRFVQTEQTVKCLNAEQVIDIFKMVEQLLETEFFYYKEV